MNSTELIKYFWEFFSQYHLWQAQLGADNISDSGTQNQLLSFLEHPDHFFSPLLDTCWDKLWKPQYLVFLS